MGLGKGRLVFDTLFRIGPGDWTFEQQRALAAFYLKNLAEAEAWALKAVEAGDGDLVWSHAILASCLAQQGKLAEARQAADRLLQCRPSFAIAGSEARGPARAADGWQRFWGGLRLAGVPA